MEHIKLTVGNLKIVGSCNGFLCMASKLPEDSVFIRNPITAECMALPGADPDFEYDGHAVGFSFHPLSKQYKVVRVYNRYTDKFDIETVSEIFTLGTESWREFDFPFLLSSPLILMTVFVGGDLHWIIDGEDDDGPLRILLFGIGNDEKFRTLPFPPTATPTLYIENVYLKDLAGKLALVNYDCRILNIWLLMDKEKGIWTHRHALSLDFEWNDFSNVTLLGLSWKFRLVLVVHKKKQSHLILFNHGSNTMEYVQVSGIPSKFLASLFVRTLISLMSI